MKKISLFLLSSAFVATLFVSSCKSGSADPAKVSEMAGKQADSLLSVQRADIMTAAQKDCDTMCMHAKESMMNAK